MSQAERLASDFQQLGLLATGYPQALEEGVSPDVVVAGEEIYLHAGIHQGYELSHHARSLAGHHVPVFVPEIPDVSEQVKGECILRRDAAEKVQKALLSFRRVGAAQAQVDVRYKKDLASHQARNISTAMPARAQ